MQQWVRDFGSPLKINNRLKWCKLKPFKPSDYYKSGRWHFAEFEATPGSYNSRCIPYVCPKKKAKLRHSASSFARQTRLAIVFSSSESNLVYSSCSAECCGLQATRVTWSAPPEAALSWRHFRWRRRRRRRGAVIRWSCWWWSRCSGRRWYLCVFQWWRRPCWSLCVSAGDVDRWRGVMFDAGRSFSWLPRLTWRFHLPPVKTAWFLSNLTVAHMFVLITYIKQQYG